MRVLTLILLCGLLVPGALASVVLTSFVAVPGDSSVTFTWSTASERSNFFFCFLRNGIWTQQTTGHGNSQEPWEYEFVDAGLSQDSTYTYVFFSVGGDGYDSLGAVVISPPHWVALEELRAIGMGNRISVLWLTQSEISNDRFEILRDGVVVAALPAHNRYVGAYYYVWDDSTAGGADTYTYTLVAVHGDGRRDALGVVEGSLPVGDGPAALPEAWAVDVYPNPFNPATTLALTVPQAGAVRAVVYDVAGRQVQVLAEGMFAAGRHELRFDGGALATGLYFFQVSGPGFTATRKLMLLK